MGTLAIVGWLMQADPDPGILFGWVQAIFEQLGIWGYLQMFVTLMVVLAAVRLFMKYVGN
jgi:hypothetical protein